MENARGNHRVIICSYNSQKEIKYIEEETT
jgi:hypothetical protein